MLQLLGSFHSNVWPQQACGPLDCDVGPSAALGYGLNLIRRNLGGLFLDSRRSFFCLHRHFRRPGHVTLGGTMDRAAFLLPDARLARAQPYLWRRWILRLLGIWSYLVFDYRRLLGSFLGLLSRHLTLGRLRSSRQRGRQPSQQLQLLCHVGLVPLMPALPHPVKGLQGSGVLGVCPLLLPADLSCAVALVVHGCYGTVQGHQGGR